MYIDTGILTEIMEKASDKQNPEGHLGLATIRLFQKSRLKGGASDLEFCGVSHHLS
jgi:hypothetical protein